MKRKRRTRITRGQVANFLIQTAIETFFGVSVYCWLSESGWWVLRLIGKVFFLASIFGFVLLVYEGDND